MRTLSTLSCPSYEPRGLGRPLGNLAAAGLSPWHSHMHHLEFEPLALLRPARQGRVAAGALPCGDTLSDSADAASDVDSAPSDDPDDSTMVIIVAASVSGCLLLVVVVVAVVLRRRAKLGAVVRHDETVGSASINGSKYCR